MHSPQDSIYWSLLYMLVTVKEYELLYYDEAEQEAWLEGAARGKRIILRLKRRDVDWSRQLREDMTEMYPLAEQMRKRGFGKGAAMYNVYVSQWEPVDAWEETARELAVRMPVETRFLTEAGNNRKFMEECLQLREEELRTLLALQQEDAHVLRYRFVSALRQQQQKRDRILHYAKPYVTRILIAVQIIMFLLLEWFGGSQNTATLIAFGAKVNSLIAQGEWWRLFTPMVLHIGLLHLLMNTVALYYVGTQVERVVGTWRFLAIYIFAGFCGSLLSFIFSDGISAGASGAIFGCFAALFYILRTYAQVFSRSMLQSVITLIGINLLFGFVVPGIDNAGHIGGLLGGFAAAAAVHVPRQKGSAGRRLAAAAAAIGISAVLLVYGFWLRG